jgi:hypothetical protein
MNNLIDKFLTWFVDIGIQILFAIIVFIGLPILIFLFFRIIPPASEVFGR